MVPFAKFERLSLSQKAKQLNQDGKYLLSRSLGSIRIDLYSYGNFFVESWYDKLRQKLRVITPYTASDIMDLYLEELSLIDLFTN